MSAMPGKSNNVHPILASTISFRKRVKNVVTSKGIQVRGDCK